MTHELTVHVSDAIGDVAALLVRPPGARWLLVLAHGAGAGMRHVFLETLTHELAVVGIATFRYQFPYIQHGTPPDSPATLLATVRAAITAASEALPDLPLLAGGKSLGGRMTSLALSEAEGPVSIAATGLVRGVVFYGFPLHGPGRPGTARATHLERLTLPMLFFQGTRDSLADLALLRPLCAKLAPRATLHVIDTADHSFHVLKRSGTTDADVLRDLAQCTDAWARSLA